MAAIEHAYGVWSRETGLKRPSLPVQAHLAVSNGFFSPRSLRPAFRAGVQHYLSGARASALRCREHAAEIGSVDAHFAVAVFGDEPTADVLKRLLA
jgi:hypothetical protein